VKLKKIDIIEKFNFPHTI